jgi:DNA-directed RNA polymerase specialized sigma24 family protein
MKSDNPLAGHAHTDADDRGLVARARSGNRDALEALGRRHQPWIYNIALRMLAHPHDAEDATHEILLKALTRLSSFEERSSFRTWLYRIVVNHVLNTRRGRREPEALTFGCYGHGLETTPDAWLVALRRDGMAPLLATFTFHQSSAARRGEA